MGQPAGQGQDERRRATSRSLDADIPVVDLPDGGGTVRVIAGAFGGAKGAARTFSPVNLWDVRLNRDSDATLDLTEGHTAMIAVLSGRVTVNDVEPAGEAEVVRFERDGSSVRLHADAESMLLVMTGEPLDDPVVRLTALFVMTNEARKSGQAIDDFNRGRVRLRGWRQGVR